MSLNLSKIIPKIGSFSAKEDAPDIKTEKFSSKYTGGLAGNASIGYRTGNFRVELEGLASSVTTDNKHIEIKNPRGSMISFDDIYDDPNHVIEIRVMNQDGSDYKVISRENSKTFKNFETSDEYHNFIATNSKITNEGFQSKAAMINAYYDINNSSSFIPYLGVGGGLTNVKFFGVSKIQPAMQGKLGLNYNISDKIQLSAGYRYFVTLGDTHFRGIKLDKEIPTLEYVIEDSDTKTIKKKVSIPGSTTATVESNFANHALEVGLTYNF